MLTATWVTVCIQTMSNTVINQSKVDIARHQNALSYYLQAHEHRRKARKHLKNGQRKAVWQEPNAVQDNLIYTEIVLPLASTEQTVMKAQRLLTYNTSAKANHSLAEGVQYISVTVDTPLSQARKSITTRLILPLYIFVSQTRMVIFVKANQLNYKRKI